ncbi:MAG TPA: HAD-IIIA family hydrolase [Mariprofundaceae bacterium]|nr:HAD-IIIA family hydrolase [Mariprofundaceae bacterium]
MPTHGFDFPFTRASGIRLLILDVDGVLTDGSIIMDHAGNELKAFNVRDGHGIKMLQRAGIQIGIITGRSSPVVAARANDLGIEHVIQGALDKSKALDQMREMSGIDCRHSAFMGDDVIDLPPMRRCGLALAPGDAHPAVLKSVDWASTLPGGRGAVRQAAEGLLLANGVWSEIVESRYGVSPDDCGWAT